MKKVLALTVAASLTLPVFSPTTLAESVAWDQAEQQWLTQESDHFSNSLPLRASSSSGTLTRYRRAGSFRTHFFFGYQPEEKTEIVIVDEFDYSNGWATVFPYPQIRLYMSPPDDVNGLESNDEWLHLLIRHEYVHIMHLEMGGGAPEFLRNIFLVAMSFCIHTL
ncbi:hypothetical protein QW180_28145 [Vibrio sinaloensis]|nr:hypothetical protein [Vibrio sinaloensis]